MPTFKDTITVDTITVPAEQWERLTEMYSGMAAVDQGDDCCSKKSKCDSPDLVKVKISKLRGQVYTSFGMIHGGLEHSCIDAWVLCAESQYSGPTHVIYHDSAAIDAGRRDRGDHEGLLVTHKGTRYVLTHPTRILMSLPSAEAIVGLEEAQAYDRAGSFFGWRALWCKGSKPRWMTLAGFSAATYTSTSGPPTSLTMLYYRLGKRIAELRVKDVSRFEIIRPVPTVSPLRAAVARAVLLRSHHINRPGRVTEQ
ncbi:MAG: hypothetical protein PHR30_14945 [Gallionellaceae bacterium]|nr:hypothetical protein [Gallionellaceae bacterium]